MQKTANYIPLGNRNCFTTKLDVSPMDDGVRWKLNKSLVYVDDEGNLITVPAGFITDFASIPPLATIGGWVIIFAVFLSRICPLTGWGLFGFALWVVMISDGMEHEGSWDAASCLHDWLYATRCRSFLKSNWILYRAMIAKGGGWTILWKRVVIFLGVELGGYVAWMDDKRKAQVRLTIK